MRHAMLFKHIEQPIKQRDTVSEVYNNLRTVYFVILLGLREADLS